MRYIAFDVETPNYANNRMSAIGITVVEDGEISREFHTLINPETQFDYFNVRLTGITPEMVLDKPTFGQLWPLIEPYMSSGLLIAHNAPFDMSVLAKCLTAYQIDWKPYADYACTCQMGRACYPQMVNHRLNTMCDCLKLELEHHNAGSDSRACAELLRNYMARGLDVKRYVRQYDMIFCCTRRY